MLRAEGIHRSFGNLQVLKGIDLEVKDNEIVSIVGASGAGKSTLLHILGTLDRPDSGNVYYDENPVGNLDDQALSAFRNKTIGFVFQFHHLLPEFTALENVCIPAYIAGLSKKEAESKAERLLGFLNLLERKDHKPSEMSGGEQQRVAIARALINDPKIVLADEPSGNLDSRSSEDLHKLFVELRSSFHYTFVLVTHNNELAKKADRILTIRDGLIIDH